MSDGLHHGDALIEEARLELGRAHTAAITMSAGDIRRSLALAVDHLRAMPPGGAAGVSEATCRECLEKLELALADLDGGSLMAMATLVEEVRKALEAA